MRRIGGKGATFATLGRESLFSASTLRAARGFPGGEFTADCLFQQAVRILAKLHVPQPNGGFTVKFLSYLVGSFAALTALTAFASLAQAKEVSYVLQTPGVV